LCLIGQSALRDGPTIEGSKYMTCRSLMKVAVFSCLALVCLAAPASATIVLSDDFSAANGGLSGTTPDVSTGNWTATAAAATPIQISGQKAAIGSSGQDEYAAFSSSVPHTNGNAIFSGLTINLSAVQATGDYFFHLSDPVGTSTLFFQRLFAKSTTGGYLLGITETSGTGATTDYGTTVLNLNTSYRVAVDWSFVAGGTPNDTFKVYVDPTDNIEANNTAYVTHTWTSVSAEPGQLTAGNLRQGSGTAAPTLTADDLIVATTFAEVTGIPEASPALFGAMICGVVGLAYGGRKLFGRKSEQ
jgi:hypothetical protein